MREPSPPVGADRFVALVVQLAIENARRRQRPYASVVVSGGQVIGQGVNTVLRDGDPTAHAEVAAVRDACASTGQRSLPGAYLVASCHPCQMCQAVTRLVGIDLVVYAGKCATGGIEMPDLSIVLLPEPGAREPFEEFAQTGLPAVDRPRQADHR